MVALTGWVPDSLPSFQLTAVTVVGVSDGLSRTTCNDPAAGLISGDDRGDLFGSGTRGYGERG